VALKGLQRTWYRLLGPLVARRMKTDHLTESLQRARVPVRPEAFMANAIATGLLTFFVTLLFCVTFIVAIIPRLQARLPILGRVQILLWILPFVAGFIIYTLTVSDLSSRAKKRAKDINLKLPYALNYVAAMASAGVIPTEIFRSLGKQRIYGEVAKEASWIYKDIALHGIDIVTALKRAQERSPSIKFQEFLQGAITTITSGGDLKNYFLEKAARYQFENRQDQKAFIDTMGLMAETYVTVAVAGPLFMIVMMAIIAIISGAGPNNLSMLVYILMPVINFGYVFLLKSLIPEV
jgi:archaeal flagellar protein FlaJ